MISILADSTPVLTEKKKNIYFHVYGHTSTKMHTDTVKFEVFFAMIGRNLLVLWNSVRKECMLGKLKLKNWL